MLNSNLAAPSGEVADHTPPPPRTVKVATTNKKETQFHFLSYLVEFPAAFLFFQLPKDRYCNQLRSKCTQDMYTRSIIAAFAHFEQHALLLSLLLFVGHSSVTTLGQNTRPAALGPVAELCCRLPGDVISF